MSKINKATLILVVILIVVVAIGFWVYKQVSSQIQYEQTPQVKTPAEVELSFDPNGPYAILTPRADGDALTLDLKRVLGYGNISYELAYNDADGIARGVVGTIPTSDGKDEYSQEILFGTCSRNVCKYDKGVSVGTLTLHIKKNNQSYKMVTSWHIQPVSDKTPFTSADTHFTYQPKTGSSSPGYVIINDLTAVPTLSQNQQISSKVYSLSGSNSKDFPKGTVSLEVANTPTAKSQIEYFDLQSNSWTPLQTQISGDTLEAQAAGLGIFLVSEKN